MQAAKYFLQILFIVSFSTLLWPGNVCLGNPTVVNGSFEDVAGITWTTHSDWAQNYGYVYNLANEDGTVTNGDGSKVNYRTTPQRIPGWTMNVESGTNGNIIINNNTAEGRNYFLGANYSLKSGSNAAIIQNDATNGNIITACFTTTITGLTAGKTYDLSYDMVNKDSYAFQTLAVTSSVGNNILQNAVSPSVAVKNSAGKYCLETQRFSFTATGETMDFSLAVTAPANKQGLLVFDNLAVSATPIRIYSTANQAGTIAYQATAARYFNETFETASKTFIKDKPMASGDFNSVLPTGATSTQWMTSGYYYLIGSYHNAENGALSAGAFSNYFTPVSLSSLDSSLARLSMDFCMNTAAFNTNIYDQRGFGVALGFVDSSKVKNNSEPGAGFSGVYVNPDGTIHFCNPSWGANYNFVNEQIGTIANFDKLNTYNIALDLQFSKDRANATLIGVSVDDQYIPVTNSGFTFATTQSIGLLGRTDAWNHVGLVRNVSLTGLESAAPEFMRVGDKLSTTFKGEGNTAYADLQMYPGDVNDFYAKTVWTGRGYAANPDYAKYNKLSADGASMETGACSGLASLLNVAQCTEGGRLALSFKMGTLTKNTSPAFDQKSFGIGLGFYDSEVVNSAGTTWEPGYGYSGIIITPDGEVSFYNNEATDWNGSNSYKNVKSLLTISGFDPDAWYDIALDVDFLGADKSTALLTGLQLDDVYYNFDDASLTFATTDQLGFFSRGGDWNQLGYIANIGFANQEKVPEPSTWALLVLGAVGLAFWRKRK